MKKSSRPITTHSLKTTQILINDKNKVWKWILILINKFFFKEKKNCKGEGGAKKTTTKMSERNQCPYTSASQQC